MPMPSVICCATLQSVLAGPFWGSSTSAANDVLNQVSIDTGGGEIHDHGPKFSLLGRSGYSIDYHLHVPRHLAAEFHTMNGGIDLASLDDAGFNHLAAPTFEPDALSTSILEYAHARQWSRIAEKTAAN